MIERTPQTPDEVTDELLQAAAEAMAIDPEAQWAIDVPVVRQVYAAGTWLAVKLFELGADHEAAKKATFVHGQMAFGADPWLKAVEVLDLWRAGTLPEPGAALAEQLLAASGDVSLGALTELMVQLSEADRR